MRSAKPDTVYLYVMGFEEGGPVKVGFAQCPETRRKQLAAKEGETLIVLGFAPQAAMKAHCTERYVHWLLRERHFKGEWFNVDKQTALAAVHDGIAKWQTVNAPWFVPAIDKVGKGLGYKQHISTLFPDGYRHTLDAALAPGESRSDLIREAIEAELKRRERGK